MLSGEDLVDALADNDLRRGEHLAALKHVPTDHVALVIGQGHVQVAPVPRYRARQRDDLEALLQAHSLILVRGGRVGQAKTNLRFARGGDGIGVSGQSGLKNLLGSGKRSESRTFFSEPTHVTMHPASSFSPLAYATRLFFRSCPGVSLNA